MAATGTPRFVPDPPAGAGEGDLFRKLLFLTALRLIVATALLVATAALTLGPGPEDLPRSVEATLYFIVGGIYLGSLISTWVLRSGRFLSVVAYGQIVADVVAASVLVFLTGGAESVFTILYPLAIVNAAIGLGRRGAVAGGVGSAIAFCLLAVAFERSWLLPPVAFADRPPMPVPRLLLTLAANLSAFGLTALLSAHLAVALQGARTELQQLKVRYQSIVDSMNSGIVTTDAQGVVSYANPAFCELLGIDASAVVGRPLRERLAVLAEAGGEGEAEVHTPRGERVFHYAVSKLEDRNLPGHTILVQDRTDLRRAQEDLRRADKLAALGKLSAGLAHEIRNPLAAMCGSIRMLGQARALSEEDRKLMLMVSQEGDRLETLVSDFLAFARPPEPQLSDVDPKQLVEETLAIFGQDPAVSVSCEARAGLRVRGDEGQLRQVLWNLLNNARDAVGSGGSVSVRVREKSGHAILDVEDGGPGIPADDLPRIFDPFFTTKPAGTGLGLAIVHRIVEAHGGQVAVESLPGMTRISVALPLA